MAPEQLAGDELSERTDIYALGLVLYELFTGKPAFKPSSPAEMARLQRETAPNSLASHVDTLDPAVERGILHCLETDPAKRPNSALSVAAGLPGGDPLAAALAAGETPSPEMVVAGGEEEGLLSRGIAGLLLGVLGICLLGSLFLADSLSLASRMALPKKPEVLEEEARQLVEALGYDTEGNDHVAGFATDRGYLNYLRRENEESDRWDKLRTSPPSAVHFWYRQSPNTLRPVLDNVTINPVSRRNTSFQPGMIDVLLDHDGRLLEFRAAPRLFERDSTEVPTAESVSPGVEWADLFDRAGLDIARFEEPPEPLAPRRNFRMDCDERRSWIGTLSNENPLPIRVEGGAIGGRVAAFEVLPPWQLPTVKNPGASTGKGILNAIVPIGFLAMIISIILIGFRHLRLGRGDRRGATVVAAIILTSHMLWWLFSVSRFPQVVEGILADFLLSLATSFFWAALGWIFYVALEPYLRRRWPHRIISWARLLAGRWKDPLVGRDLLIGLSVGSALAVGGASIIHLVQGEFDPSILGSFSGDLSIRSTLGRMFLGGLLAVTAGLAAVILPILLQFVVRKMSLALALTWFFVALLVLGPMAAQGPHWVADAAIAAIRAGVFLYLLLRFGLLAGTAAIYAGLVLSFQGSTSIGAWYAQPLLTAIVVLATLGGYVFFTSLAGRPMLRNDADSF
jgi:serine/threonine-protein kinase